MARCRPPAARQDDTTITTTTRRLLALRRGPLAARLACGPRRDPGAARPAERAGPRSGAGGTGKGRVSPWSVGWRARRGVEQLFDPGCWGCPGVGARSLAALRWSSLHERLGVRPVRLSPGTAVGLWGK